MVLFPLALYARSVSVPNQRRAAKRLAATVRARRRAMGLTQEEAAHQMQLSTRHYQKLEGAELNVTLRTLVRVAAALKLSLSELLR